MKKWRMWMSVAMLAGSLGLIVSGCAGLGAAAVVGGIAYYKSAQYESATVAIDAPADKIYQVALETIAKNESVKVTSKDPEKYVIEMKVEKQKISLKVTAMSPTLSQLMVTSNVLEGQPGSPDLVLKGVAAICDRFGVPHRVIQ